MPDAIHHFHSRKRVHEKLEPYPHPNKWKNLMDRAIYLVSIAGPIMTIPQLMKIWVNHEAAGVSIISWSSYAVIASFWLAYGLMHKEKPIIISSSLWVAMDIMVVVGALLYGSP